MALACLLLICFRGVECLTQEKVMLMDNFGSNLLFRSDSPLSKKLGEYQYDALVSYMKKAAKDKGVEFPTEFKLVNIALLQRYFHFMTTETISKFFESNPERGKFISWFVLGMHLGDPDEAWGFFSGIWTRFYRYWNFDNLPGLIDMLQSELKPGDQEDKSTPKVILFHCIDGVS